MWQVEGLVDTGAEGTVIVASSVENLPRLACKDKLLGANGQPLEVLGTVEVPFVFQGLPLTFVAYVVPDICLVEKVIIGYDFLKYHNAIINFLKGELSLGSGKNIQKTTLNRYLTGRTPKLLTNVRFSNNILKLSKEIVLDKDECILIEPDKLINEDNFKINKHLCMKLKLLPLWRESKLSLQNVRKNKKRIQKKSNYWNSRN